MHPAMNLKPETLKKIDEVITHYPVKRSATLPLLHLIQEDVGWISKEAIEWIADLIADKARLLDPKGNDVFAGRFSPLMQRDAETIYADILRRLFNAEARQRLAELGR